MQLPSWPSGTSAVPQSFQLAVHTQLAHQVKEDYSTTQPHQSTEMTLEMATSHIKVTHLNWGKPSPAETAEVALLKHDLKIIVGCMYLFTVQYCMHIKIWLTSWAMV